MEFSNPTGYQPQADSSRKRPAMVAGALATSDGYLVPDHICRKFTHDGWATYVPLTYLTNKYCAFKNGSSVPQETISLNSSGKLQTASKPLSCDRELDLSFDKWHQAWTQLLPLIHNILPSYKFNSWKVHYKTILCAETRAEMWSLWLAYDMDICKRAIHLGIDPSVHHIHVWNQLKKRDIKANIQKRLENNMQHYNSSGQNCGESNRRTGLVFVQMTPFEMTLNLDGMVNVLFAATSQALTHPDPVMPQTSPTESHVISQGNPQMNTVAIRMENPTASNSTDSTAASKAPTANVNMHVPSVDPEHITRNLATHSEFTLIVTPFIVDTWEHVLTM
ncbi:hypothetical protein B0H34DRAFT_672670 [Crassisporium funariophilum]|nr:hypothetical protein B0H34DRAFT_672670 [Crassisporium funariophilum]